MNTKYFFGLVLFLVLFLAGCIVDEEAYLMNIYNETGGSFFQGNCSGGVTEINSDGVMICRDVSIYYEHLESNQTHRVGTGTLVEFLNSSETIGMTYYEIIGDDSKNG